MVGNVIENNKVVLSGKFASEMEFNHEVCGESFYNFFLEVRRLSESTDIIPVTISERLFNGMSLDIDTYVEVEGQFRSYNSYNKEGNKLLLTVFARDIKIIETDKDLKNPNEIFLNGFICKKPIYRITPFGREIADLLIAVNRPYNKSDYIPCIAWGRDAKYCENLIISDNIKVWGRIQSRKYQKVLDEENVISKTAYEISVSKMEIVKTESV